MVSLANLNELNLNVWFSVVYYTSVISYRFGKACCGGVVKSLAFDRSDPVAVFFTAGGSLVEFDEFFAAVVFAFATVLNFLLQGTFPNLAIAAVEVKIATL